MCEDFIVDLVSKILKILLLVSLKDIEECVKILLLIYSPRYWRMCEDFVVDLVSKLLKNEWRFYCWFNLKNIEESVKILCWFSLKNIQDFIVDLVSKILKNVWRIYWKLYVFLCLYTGFKMKLSTQNSFNSLTINNFYIIFSSLHIITKMDRHHPTHNAVLCHKRNDPSRITSPNLKVRVKTTNLKTLCYLTLQRLSFATACSTCCMFKAGKCYERKSSEILHNMVVTKLDGKGCVFWC
jgi:hypothetical protein